MVRGTLKLDRLRLNASIYCYVNLFIYICFRIYHSFSNQCLSSLVMLRVRAPSFGCLRIYTVQYNHLSLSLSFYSLIIFPLTPCVRMLRLPRVFHCKREQSLEECGEELVNRLLLSSVCTVKSYLP